MNLTTLTPRQKQLRKRILEISHNQGLSHLGSCLSSIDIIDAIHQLKKPGEPFVLSNGHAGIALYVVLESLGLINEADIKSMYIHPDRNPDKGIDVSTGSLGQGLPIALGLALADRFSNVYCLISDGEIAEGSIWEALRVSSQLNLSNLKLVLNANGWGAYDQIDLSPISKRFQSFGWQVDEVDGHLTDAILGKLSQISPTPRVVMANTSVEHFPFLKGQDAHYYKMTEADFRSALQILEPTILEKPVDHVVYE